MRYRNILYTTHHLIRTTGCVEEYFRERADAFHVFSISPTFMDVPTTLVSYAGGVRTRERKYHWYRGRCLPLQYVFIYLYYLHVRLFVLPRGTDVISFHPLLCVGRSLLGFLRGGRMMFWVWDYFAQFDGWYFWYNRLADFHVRHTPVVRFLSQAMLDEYARRLGRPAGHDWQALGIGLKVEPARRAPERGLMGFIGNLKGGQGVERLIEAVRLDAGLRLEIVGDGVSLDELRKLAAMSGTSDRISFLGIITDETRLAEVCSRWEVGAALYESGSYMAWCDPGKIKTYLRFGLPVLTTDVTPMGTVLHQTGAGEVVTPEAASVVAAMSRIGSAYASYSDAAENLRLRYEYRTIYDRGFAPLAV